MIHERFPVAFAESTHVLHSVGLAKMNMNYPNGAIAALELLLNTSGT
jgi:hypothetical protein